jgi:hypothetical protein
MWVPARPAVRYAVVRILHAFDDLVIFLYLELKFNIMDITRAA